MLIRFCCVFVLTCIEDFEREQKPTGVNQGVLVVRIIDYLVTIVKGWFCLSQFGEFT